MSAIGAGEEVMTSPGWIAAVGCAVLLIVVNSVIWFVVSQAANGAGRSYTSGIRLPSLMKSEQAWHEGHVAGRHAMGPWLLMAAVVAVASIPLQRWPVVYIAALGLSLVGTLLALLFGSISAVGAAKRAEAP